MRIRVIGAGVAGLTAALEFGRRGHEVELVERESGPGMGCSWYAGGMIAPWCELETAEPLIAELGLEALDYWTRSVPVARQTGSLVVAPPRDQGELTRFARRTRDYEEIGANRIAALEPDLAGRFSRAIYFASEAHLDPRTALETVTERLAALANVTLRFSTEANSLSNDIDWTVDCRGFAARDALDGLRGVKGEMLVLETGEISFERAIRMLHPRTPVYVVPRHDRRFMIGATSIENEEPTRISARSVAELLGAAYALHPSFAEAEIAEMGSGLRPAFRDNLPRVEQRGRTLFINGLYRHGFLVAPSLARAAADLAQGQISDRRIASVRVERLGEVSAI